VPRNPPDPAYPDGIDLSVARRGEWPVCRVELPYPAQSIGHWVVTCQACGMTVGATAAGRRDDPRSITMPCKMR